MVMIDITAMPMIKIVIAEEDKTDTLKRGLIDGLLLDTCFYLSICSFKINLFLISCSRHSPF